MLRRGWLLVWFAGLGCHSLCLDMDRDPAEAERLWHQGQQALRDGEPTRAIGLYERSLAADPARTRNHMSLAAAHLEAGNEEAACHHLGLYVAAHPEHVIARSHYAELLLRLGRDREAAAHFERFLADAQDASDIENRHSVHAHTRLMEIAERAQDDYAVHLHRGLGLYRLAGARASLDQADDRLPVEGLLCRAARELERAHEERPRAARPCWYLYRIWSRLARTESALRYLRRAEEAAPFGDLTPAEERSLLLALAAVPSPARLGR